MTKKDKNDLVWSISPDPSDYTKLRGTLECHNPFGAGNYVERFKETLKEYIQAGESTKLDGYEFPVVVNKFMPKNLIAVANESGEFIYVTNIDEEVIDA
jgi:hypothetical protein